MQNKNGFTLIEMIIVLGLCSIMFGCASLSLVAIERCKLKQTLNKLCTEIRYCQRNAIEEKRKHEISFDKTNNKYFIKRSDDTGLLVKISEIELPNGIKFAATPSSIGYTKNGTIEEGGTIALSGNYS